jgi:hypothetical protein
MSGSRSAPDLSLKDDFIHTTLTDIQDVEDLRKRFKKPTTISLDDNDLKELLLPNPLPTFNPDNTYSEAEVVRGYYRVRHRGAHAWAKQARLINDKLAYLQREIKHAARPSPEEESVRDSQARLIPLVEEVRRLVTDIDHYHTMKLDRDYPGKAYAAVHQRSLVPERSALIILWNQILDPMWHAIIESNAYAKKEISYGLQDCIRDTTAAFEKLKVEIPKLGNPMTFFKPKTDIDKLCELRLEMAERMRREPMPTPEVYDELTVDCPYVALEGDPQMPGIESSPSETSDAASRADQELKLAMRGLKDSGADETQVKLLTAKMLRQRLEKLNPNNANQLKLVRRQ